MSQTDRIIAWLYGFNTAAYAALGAVGRSPLETALCFLAAVIWAVAFALHCIGSRAA